MKRLCALMSALAVVAAAGCAPTVKTVPESNMKDRYVAAAGDCLEWIKKQMLTFDDGAWGVYERVEKRTRKSLPSRYGF